MASFNQEVRNSLRESFEQRTGIIGQVLKERRQKQTYEKEVATQITKIEEATTRVRNDNNAFRKIEVATIQISENLQLINNWAGAQVTTLEETQQALEQQSTFVERSDVASIKIPDPKEDESTLNGILDLFDKLGTKIKRKFPKGLKLPKGTGKGFKTKVGKVLRHKYTKGAILTGLGIAAIAYTGSAAAVQAPAASRDLEAERRIREQKALEDQRKAQQEEAIAKQQADEREARERERAAAEERLKQEKAAAEEKAKQEKAEEERLKAEKAAYEAKQAAEASARQAAAEKDIAQKARLQKEAEEKQKKADEEKNKANQIAAEERRRSEEAAAKTKAEQQAKADEEKKKKKQEEIDRLEKERQELQRIAEEKKAKAKAKAQEAKPPPKAAVTTPKPTPTPAPIDTTALPRKETANPPGALVTAKPTAAINNKPVGEIFTYQPDVTMSPLNPIFAERLTAMAIDFKEKTGNPLQVNAGFRSTERQKLLYSVWRKAGGRTNGEMGGKKGDGKAITPNTAKTKADANSGLNPDGTPYDYTAYEEAVSLKLGNTPAVAAPGTSMHEFGAAVDIQPTSGPKGTGDPKGYLEELTGPLSSPTKWLDQFGLSRPIGDEPWHVQLKDKVQGEDGEWVAQGNKSYKNVRTGDIIGAASIDVKSLTMGQISTKNVIIMAQKNLDTKYVASRMLQHRASTGAAVG